MNRIAFHALVDELSKTMQYSQIALEQTALEHFLSYFSKKEDAFEPETRQIKVSYFEQEEKKQGSFFVPTASLVSHNSIALDEIHVTLQTDLYMEENDLYADLKNGGEETDSDDTAKKGDACNCKIELKFKNHHPAEGIREAVNMLNKTI